MSLFEISMSFHNEGFNNEQVFGKYNYKENITECCRLKT